MTFVPQSRTLPRYLWRPAIFFFAVAQIFLSFAPLLEGRPNARTHAEATGTAAHYAHNEADCAACTARHLAASSEIIVPALVETQRNTPGTPSTSVEAFHHSEWSQSRSRAPPAAV